jgi:hypothetical protein
MTDFRALCAELLQELEHASAWDYQQALKDQARAALAQPEPVVVTDEAPEKDAPVWYNSDMASSWEAGRRGGWSDAIASYGTLAIELAPENVDELVSEKLPDLRQNLETVIRCSRSYDGYSTMTPIELADRIIDAVVSWHPSTLPHQRADRRPSPKPPSLREKALKGFNTMARIVLDEYYGTTSYEEYRKVTDTIIRALEALPE